jgi:hypothetical protein
MKVLVRLTLFSLILVSSPIFAEGTNLSFSGLIAAELTYYPNEGNYENKTLEQASLSIEPEIRYSWKNEKHITTFKPFLRIDSNDNKRTHQDIRELNYIGVYGDFDTKIGISKEFWGVTESTHLVDVINQTDQIENINGESKLGQLMVNLNYNTDYGAFNFFILPGFRERTFAGEDGRFRGQLKIETSEAIYTDSEKQDKIDYALRWSHYLGNLEWAISYFKGTDRDPFLEVNSNNDLVPIYTQMDQQTIELQYIIDDWILKSENLSRNSDLEDRYYSTVTGFEYTFSNIAQRGLDVGLISEWVFDERREKTQGAFYNHTFFGSRVAINDANSTEMIGGIFINNSNSKVTSFKLEANRRINQNLKWEFETNLIIEPEDGNLLSNFKDDDYSQVKILYYW